MALPGTTLFTDDFNRTNGALGANWDDGYTGCSSLEIVGNRVRASVNTGVDCLESVSSVSLPNDQWGLVQLTALSNADASIRGVQVWLRMSAPSSAAGYIFVAYNQLAAGEDSAILDGALGTVLASENSTPWAAGDWLLATAQGTTLTLYRLASGGDPDSDTFTQVLQTTSSLYSSGRGGINIFIGSGVALSEAEADNVRFGQFGFASGRRFLLVRR